MLSADRDPGHLTLPFFGPLLSQSAFRYRFVARLSAWWIRRPGITRIQILVTKRLATLRAQAAIGRYSWAPKYSSKFAHRRGERRRSCAVKNRRQTVRFFYAFGASPCLRDRARPSLLESHSRRHAQLIFLNRRARCPESRRTTKLGIIGIELPETLLQHWAEKCPECERGPTNHVPDFMQTGVSITAPRVSVGDAPVVADRRLTRRRRTFDIRQQARAATWRSRESSKIDEDCIAER